MLITVMRSNAAVEFLRWAARSKDVSSSRQTSPTTIDNVAHGAALPPLLGVVPASGVLCLSINDLEDRF